MLQSGSHLAQDNVSQGFKSYKTWCSAVGRSAPKFEAYKAREDVAAAYGIGAVEAPVAVVSDLSKLTKAQLIALVSGGAPAAPKAPKARSRKPKTIGVGTVFEYVRKDGTTTQRRITSVEDGGYGVFNVEHNVQSKRVWRGLDRQIAAKRAKVIA